VNDSCYSHFLGVTFQAQLSIQTQWSFAFFTFEFFLLRHTLSLHIDCSTFLCARFSRGHPNTKNVIPIAIHPSVGLFGLILLPKSLGCNGSGLSAVGSELVNWAIKYKNPMLIVPQKIRSVKSILACG